MAEAVLPPAGVKDEDIATQRRTLRDYYIMLRERVWVALPLALLVAVGYGYWKSKDVPMYSSTATLQFEKPEDIVDKGVFDAAARSSVDIGTYIGVIESAALQSDVTKSFSPDEQKILLRAAVKKLDPGQPPPSYASELGHVYAAPVGGTYLITITVQHPDPEAAALIANRYVDVFMKYEMEQSTGENSYAATYVAKQVDDLKKQFTDSENTLQKYLSDHQLVSLVDSLNLVADTLKTVSSKKTEAQLELVRLQTLAEDVKDHQAKGQNPLDISWVASQPGIAGLRQQLIQAQQEKLAQSERYGENFPKIVELNGRIRDTQDLLAKEVSQAISDLDTQINEQKRSVDSLSREYDRDTQRELELKAMSVEFDTLKQQADSARANYSNILTRLNEINTSKGANIEKIPIRPLDKAVPNGTPYAPNRTQITRTAVSFFALTFVGVSVGLSFLDDRIKSAWDIESFIGVNLLGIIPELGSIKPEDKHLLLIGNKPPQAVEPFLGVYSSIKIHSRLDFPKSILVTSTIPGEGKTLISSNLAGCFARHGKRTLLIDCDLRRPMLHRHFNMQNQAGLLNWYDNGANLEGDLLVEPSLGISKIAENFFLLTSGGRSKSPTALLESPSFGQLLEKFKQRFDVVVIDSPPMGAVTDGVLIAERADEIVYVCRFNRAYRKHIKLYMRTLQNGKNTVLGIVLNGLSPRRIEYYSNYRYYRSYKKYYGAQT